MRINSICAAILLAVFLIVSTVSCNQSTNHQGIIPPGVSIVNAPIVYVANSVNVTAGKATSIDATFETKKNGPGKFSLQILYIGTPFMGGTPPELPMPNGLKVSIEPKQVMAYPNHIYHGTIFINTSAELAPGVYWLQVISLLKM